MSKQYTEQDEPRIRELTKSINTVLNTLYKLLQELYEGVYGGECEEKYKEILSKIVLIEQEDLPVAEMKYKRIGEDE